MRHMFSSGWTVLAAVISTSAAQVPSAAAPVPPVPVEVPPTPAFKSGDPVIDSSGALVGTIATLTESAQGAIVVLSIESKLVGVPQSTLKLDGDRVMSSQTKAQMLAAANAPR